MTRNVLTLDGSRVGRRCVLAAVAILALTACQGGDASPSGSGDDELVTVKVAYPSPAISMLYMHIAAEKNFDEAHGVNIQMDRLKGSTLVSALVGGQYSYAISTGQALPAALKGGLPRIQRVYNYQPNFFVFAQSEIKEPRELIGKNIRVGTVGPGSAAFSVFLEKNGIGEGQVTLQVGGSDSTALQALLSGTADAAVMAMPNQIALDRQGFTNLGYLGELLNYPTMGLVINEDELSDNPEVAAGVTAAADEAVAFMLDPANREEVSNMFLAFAEGRGLESPGDAREALEVYFDTLNSSGKLDLELANEIIDTAADVLEVPNPAPLSEVFSEDAIDG